MTYYLYFIQTLITRCTVSQILAEVDHKGPNWTFLTLKMTFTVIPHHSYFRTGLLSQQRSYMMQYIWAAWENGPNLTFPTFKMTFWIIQSLPSLDSWSISSPRSCMQDIKKIYQKVAKQPNLTLFGPFGPFKITFRAIQSNPSFDSSLVPSLGSFLHK